MNVRSLAAALWRRRWLALAVFVAEMAAIVLGLAVASRSYTAVATLTAVPRQALLASPGNFDNLETTLAQLVDSRSVLEDVRARIADARSVDQLRTEVTGVRVTGTVLIRVTVVDADPRLAAQIANTVVEVLPLHDPSGGLFMFSTADSAESPSSYSSPNVKVVLLVGVVLGVLLAVAAALIRDNAARTVETEEELRDATGTDVLGVVFTRRDVSTSSLVDPPAPDEDFRAVRVALEFAYGDMPIRTVVIASAVPGENNRWLAANLAVSLAQVRHNVLIVDCGDRGYPPTADAPATPGVYDVLRGATTLDRALVPGATDRVTILPAGTAGTAETKATTNAATNVDVESSVTVGVQPATKSAGRSAGSTVARPGTKSTARMAAKVRDRAPSEDMSDENLLELHFHRLIAELGDRFDVVLVLARSPAESEDARILAVGGSLLLAVPSHRARPGALRRMVEELRAVQTRVVGTVLVSSRRTIRGDR